MTEMFGEAWLPMSVTDLAPDDDDDDDDDRSHERYFGVNAVYQMYFFNINLVSTSVQELKNFHHNMDKNYVQS